MIVRCLKFYNPPPGQQIREIDCEDNMTRSRQLKPVKDKQGTFRVTGSPMYQAGEVLELEDETARLGINTGFLAEVGGKATAEPVATAEPRPEFESETEEKATAEPEDEDDGVIASDGVRERAQEMGIDITKVTPTGSKGNVLVRDLEAYEDAQKGEE